MINQWTPKQGGVADPEHIEGDGGLGALAGTSNGAPHDASDGPARQECGDVPGETMPAPEGAGVGARPYAAIAFSWDWAKRDIVDLQIDDCFLDEYDSDDLFVALRDALDEWLRR